MSINTWHVSQTTHLEDIVGIRSQENELKLGDAVDILR